MLKKGDRVEAQVGDWPHTWATVTIVEVQASPSGVAMFRVVDERGVFTWVGNRAVREVR